MDEQEMEIKTEGGSFWVRQDSEEGVTFSLAGGGILSFHRALTPEEILSLSENPYQIFTHEKRPWYCRFGGWLRRKVYSPIRILCNKE